MSSEVPPVLGRRSPAAATEPLLGHAGEAAGSCYRVEGGSTPWCSLRAVSVTGVRHRLSGQPGEDSFAWARAEAHLAVAVADGLGSVAASGGAARRAARAAADAAAAHVAAGAAAGSAGVEGAAAAVEGGLAAANEAAGGGGATTLVLAVVGEDGCVDAGRVGDSTAFVVAAGGRSWVEVFSGHGDDGAVGTETDALPSEGPQWEVARVRLDRSEVLVLATDGLADPWRDGPQTVAPALAEAVAGHPSARELARLADFSRQGCHDDRTLLCVWMRAPVE